MARGTVVGEAVVSQANTDAYREAYDRSFGDRKPERGTWVWNREQQRMVPLGEHVPPPRALDAPIIADRIHEGTTFDDGERVRDLGSRRKRREFLRETGLAEANDYSRSYREQAFKQQQRDHDRRIDAASEQAVRKLHEQRKWRE
jgi:hypothetical protein